MGNLQEPRPIAVDLREGGGAPNPALIISFIKIHTAHRIQIILLLLFCAAVRGTYASEHLH